MVILHVLGSQVTPEPVTPIVLERDDDCRDKHCLDCAQQFTGIKMSSIPLEDIRAARGIPDSAAQEIAADLAKQNTETHQYLRARVLQYGDAILSKWKKLSKTKREGLILKAQPDLYLHKAANFRINFRMDGPIKELPVGYQGCEDLPTISFQDPRYRNALLAPWFNLETLKQDPMRLMGLLYHRTAHELEEWIPFDMLQMKLGFEPGWLFPPFNDNSLVLHGTKYGELVQYRREEAHRYSTVGWPRGMLALQCQSLILGFLRRATDLLIPGAGTKEGNSQFVSLSANGLKASGEVEQWSAYANAPFSSPPRFDPTESLLRVKAQLAAAEDYIVSLQTDPAFLQGILSTQRRSELYKKMQKRQLWEMLAAEIHHYPMHHIRRLRAVVDELEHVVKIYDSFRDQIHLDSKLPPKYDRAMSSLELLCITLYREEREELRRILPQCQGFAQNYDVRKLEDGRVSYGAKKTHPAGDQGQTKRYETWQEGYFRHDLLHLLLLRLMEDPEDFGEEYPPNIMGLLEEHLAMADHKERQRMDQRIYDQLSRMCCYYELVWSIWLHRPFPRALKGVADLNAAELSRRSWRLHHGSILGMKNSEKKGLSILLERFCEVPWPSGKRTEQWLEKASASRARLADFWHRAREIRHRQLSGTSYDEADLQDQISFFSADQSIEYKREVEEETHEVHRLIGIYQEAERLKQASALATPQVQWGHEGSQKDSDHIKRSKPKTRPNVPPTIEVDRLGETFEDLNIDTDTASPHLAVNTNSLRILRQMYPSGAETQTGTVRWQDFVTAMADAGFSATHRGGSAVQFSPSSGDASGSIVSIDHTQIRMWIRSYWRTWASGWGSGLGGMGRFL